MTSSKLIVFGNNPTPEQLNSKLEYIDRFPYDGTFITLPIGASTLQFTGWENTRRKHNIFRSSIKLLKENTFAHCTNLIPVLNVRPVHGASTPFDWFDADWKSRVIEMWALVARFCDEIGSPGMALDAEPYNGPIWDWAGGLLPGYTISNSSTFASYAQDLGARCALAVRDVSNTLDLFTLNSLSTLSSASNAFLYNHFMIGFASAFGSRDNSIHLGNQNTYAETGDGTAVSYYATESYDTLFSAHAEYSELEDSTTKFMAISPSGGTEDWSHTDFSLNHVTPAEFNSALDYLFAANGPYSWVYIRATDPYSLETPISTVGLLDEGYNEAIVGARITNNMSSW